MKSRSRFFLQTAAGLLALSLAACTAAPAASEEKPAEASGTYAYHIAVMTGADMWMRSH